eukprot:275963-Pyramimonas_sp.AAC.1
MPHPPRSLRVDTFITRRTLCAACAATHCGAVTHSSHFGAAGGGGPGVPLQRVRGPRGAGAAAAGHLHALRGDRARRLPHHGAPAPASINT